MNLPARLASLGLILTGCLFAENAATTTAAPAKDDAKAAAAKDEASRVVEDAKKFKLDKKRVATLPTIWLVGDSTVRVGTPNQRGWGDEISGFFDLEKVNVVNTAIGGRSSRTFQTEGRWDAVLADVQAGDVVIIQFGHNDNGKLNDDSRARGTIRSNGDETEEIDNILTKKHEVVHSFGWYIRKYIRDAKAKGATVVICSLIPRKKYVNDGDKVARATNDYTKWSREAAQQEGALFVDLNNIIATHYEELGKEKVNTFFADPHTHTSVVGAQFNAGCVIEGLKALGQNPVAKYLK